MSNSTTKFIEMIQKNQVKKITRKQGLYFLSMQVIWTLPDNKTLAEEIANMMAITYSETVYHTESICKVCEVVYHEDDQIIEFDICFTAPKYADCIKACSDLMDCNLFPKDAECIFERNQRSEQLLSQLWREQYNKKIDK